MHPFVCLVKATIAYDMLSCRVFLMVLVWMITTNSYVSPSDSLTVRVREFPPFPYPFLIRSAFSVCVWDRYRVLGESIGMEAPVYLDSLRDRVDFVINLVERVCHIQWTFI